MRPSPFNGDVLSLRVAELTQSFVEGIVKTGGTFGSCCASAASGAARAPASEVSRKRRRSMPGWWGGQCDEVKAAALASGIS